MTFSRVARLSDAGDWTLADVTGSAPHRLYHAHALERFVLSSRDERIPVPDE